MLLELSVLATQATQPAHGAQRVTGTRRHRYQRQAMSGNKVGKESKKYVEELSQGLPGCGCETV